jgi:hypothetical protein
MADLVTGLLARLPFEQTPNDVSGNARHFTSVGTPTYETDRQIGAHSARVTFINNIHYPTPTWFSGLSAYTVACWVKCTTPVAGSAVLSWGTADANQSTVIYPFDTSGGDGIRIFNKGDSGAFNINTGEPEEAGWHHIMLVVISTSSAELYIDNVLAASSGGNFSTNASLTDIMCGSYHNSAQPYTGLIDDLWIFSRALPTEDRAALYAFRGAGIVGPAYSPALSPAIPASFSPASMPLALAGG